MGFGCNVLAFSLSSPNAVNSDKIRFFVAWDVKTLRPFAAMERAEMAVRAERDAVIVPRTDTEINRNLISVLL